MTYIRQLEATPSSLLPQRTPLNSYGKVTCDAHVTQMLPHVSSMSVTCESYASHMWVFKIHIIHHMCGPRESTCGSHMDECVHV